MLRENSLLCISTAGLTMSYYLFWISIFACKSLVLGNDWDNSRE
jgi:hypothetical protein